MDTEKNWLDKAQDEVAELTPEVGYNVVAVDPFEPPGEALYLVAHFKKEDDAKREAEEHAKESGDKTYVYGPKPRAGRK